MTDNFNSKITNVTDAIVPNKVEQKSRKMTQFALVSYITSETIMHNFIILHNVILELYTHNNNNRLFQKHF